MAVILDNLKVETMTGEHVPAINAIEKRAYSLPWHGNAFSIELNNGCALYLIVKLNNELVAYGGMWLIIDEAHVTTIAVDPEHQNKGIGARLMYELLTSAMSRHIDRATLEVREGNIHAQKLYSRFGFKSVAVRKGYYPDNKENAVVMWTDDMRSEAFQALLLKEKSRLGISP